MTLIVELLRKYGAALFEPCPSNEHLVLWCEDPTLVNTPTRSRIHPHLMICAECRMKAAWVVTDRDEPGGI
jgi:hypothetical protein